MHKTLRVVADFLAYGLALIFFIGGIIERQWALAILAFIFFVAYTVLLKTPDP